MAALSLASASDRGRWARNAAVALGVNLVTHTVFWYARPARLMLAEAIVSGVEAAAYRALCGIPLPKAGAWSLLLNLTSYWLGVAAWRVLLG